MSTFENNKTLKKKPKATENSTEGRVEGLAGCLERSPVHIRELINGALVRTRKKPVPSGCTAV